MRTKVTIAIFCLLAVIAGLVALAFFGVLPTPAQKPFLPEGPLCAVLAENWAPASLTTPPDAAQPQPDAAAADAALTATVAKAKAAGANAIFFLAHPGRTVFYRSRYFAPAFAEYDPLAALCEKAAAEGIGVFAVYDADAAGPAPAALPDKSPVKNLGLAGEGALARFDLSDEKTLLAIKKDVAALTRDYPVTGVVFRAQAPAYDAMAVLADAVHAAQDDTLTVLWAELALVSSAQATELTAAGFDLLAPRMTDGTLAFADGVPFAGTAEVFCDLSGVSDPVYDALVGAGGAAEGAVIGSTAEDALALSLRGSALGHTITAEALPTVGHLALGSPAKDQTTTADHILLLGSSDPSAELLLGGVPVPRSAGGSWAVWAELSPGENRFILRQGETEISRTVTRTEQVASKPVKVPTPDTALDSALAGRYIRVSAQIAGALFDPAADSAIAQTLRAGGTAPIVGTRQTLRAGEIVTAYELATGDVILSKNAELLDDAPVAALTLSQIGTPADRQLAISFSGGTPLCYTEGADGQVSFLFLGGTLAEDTAATLAGKCAAIAAAAVTKEAAGDRLTLTFTEDFPLWGHDVSYTENGVLLRFTAAPRLSGLPGRPLSGVRVLLDAGHGGDDLGAPGIAGLSGGVCEKDVNLALTLACAERLRQLGAEVTLTRTDDSFPSLTDRWAQANAALPDFFIALHHNSVEYVKDTNGVAGVEAYYHGSQNEAFAAALLDGVALSTGRQKNFSQDSYFYVCRQTAFRSALFEFGYMVNPAELESCLSAAGLRAGAAGIARGITGYLAALS